MPLLVDFLLYRLTCLSTVEPLRESLCYRKVTECVSGVALDFQEDKWDIAKWGTPLEIEIPIEWTDVFFKKLRH